LTSLGFANCDIGRGIKAVGSNLIRELVDLNSVVCGTFADHVQGLGLHYLW
jgi:hypothetical protein